MSAKLLICSTCGGKLQSVACAEEATHTCATCGAIWDETNGWVEVGNLLIPYQSAIPKGDWQGLVIKWRRQRRGVR